MTRVHELAIAPIQALLLLPIVLYAGLLLPARAVGAPAAPATGESAPPQFLVDAAAGFATVVTLTS